MMTKLEKVLIFFYSWSIGKVEMNVWSRKSYFFFKKIKSILEDFIEGVGSFC